MEDPYRIRPTSRAATHTPTHTPAEGQPASSGPAGAVPDRSAGSGDWVTGLLWVALAVCLAGNAVVSVLQPDDVLLSVALGVPGLVCVALLVGRYLRRRQQ